MNEELKTLKDIEDGAYLDDYSIKEYTEKLRQEAIKWVKEDLLEMPITPQTSWLLNRWIERFNLTEEDFK